MRLIDVDTLELRSFTDDDIPPYAILSHTWGADEISYQELVWINRIKALSGSLNQSSMSSSFTSSSSQDEQSSLMLASMEMLLRGNWNPGTSVGSMTEEDFRDRLGYSKIVHTAREVRDLKLKWVWIDTCCIDKSSSAELQESLNSMYRWYWNAKVCLVYLSDVSRADVIDTNTATVLARVAFESCRWTKRGWTLQELLAPTTCRFYLKDWQYMGEKVEYLEELSHATGIPIPVLEDPVLVQEVSVAERMSWAASRQTTRLEDIGYCLLGLFDIQMPLLYGEGEKAFTRLQEEILKTTDDHSLFAWKANTSDSSTYRGLLARSPAEFRDCGSVERESILSAFPISSTPIGIRVQLEFLPNAVGDRSVLAMIRSCNAMNQRLAIRLKCLDGGMQYARVDAGSLVAIDDWPTGQLRTIYVRQKVSIPVDFATPEFSRFHLRRRRANHSIPHVRIIGASSQSWDWETFECAITPAQINSCVVFLLRVQSHKYAHSLTFPVAVGFNRQTCHYWCKAIADMASEREYDIMGGWWEAARRRVPKDVLDPLTGADAHHDLFVVGDGQIGINIEIKAGLCGDSISLEVHIDGLVKWS
ncbi:hypothetical protein DE146DRAFT_637487 [Phaeosphaeria sp. MPI-PUGE-AT-0046c]|nr:hypothetical protein DE146DRAFT_637487 [Phaeosphaeria sp. MPI-PUGE-AT-0046c]